MQLRNTMEGLVEQYVDHWIGNFDLCDCPVCRMDIMAIMLNKLPPLYVVTDTGALFAQMKELDFQYKADVMAAMTAAVEIIKNNPRHDVEK